MHYALLGRYYPATSVVLHAVAQDIELPVVNHLADTAMLFLRYRMGSGGVAGLDIDTQHQIKSFAGAYCSLPSWLTRNGIAPLATATSFP